MTEPKVNPDNNPVDDKGQVKGNQVNQDNPEGDTGNQPELVELPDGSKVPKDEVLKGYMKDADYRKKTAELARDREELERQMEEASRREPPTPSGGEVNFDDMTPDEVREYEHRQAMGVVQNLTGMFIQDKLERKITELKAKPEFADADPQAVFDACMANPKTQIEAEMKKSHEKIAKLKSPESIAQLIEKSPELKEALKKQFGEKAVAEYQASKKKKASQLGMSGATGEGSTLPSEEPDKPAETIEEASKRLRNTLENEPDEALD